MQLAYAQQSHDLTSRDLNHGACLIRHRDSAPVEWKRLICEKIRSRKYRCEWVSYSSRKFILLFVVNRNINFLDKEYLVINRQFVIATRSFVFNDSVRIQRTSAKFKNWAKRIERAH